MSSLISSHHLSAVHLHLAGDVLPSDGASGIGREGSCRTSRATSLLVAGRDRNLRNWSDYQGMGPRWVGRSGERVQNCSNSSNMRSLETTHFRNIRQEQSSGSRVPFVPRLLRNKLKTLAQRAKVSLTKRFRVQPFTDARREVFC